MKQRGCNWETGTIPVVAAKNLERFVGEVRSPRLGKVCRNALKLDHITVDARSLEGLLAAR